MDCLRIDPVAKTKAEYRRAGEVCQSLDRLAGQRVKQRPLRGVPRHSKTTGSKRATSKARDASRRVCWRRGDLVRALYPSWGACVASLPRRDVANLIPPIISSFNRPAKMWLSANTSSVAERDSLQRTRTLTRHMNTQRTRHLSQILI